jgi:hypothetical protein
MPLKIPIIFIPICSPFWIPYSFSPKSTSQASSSLNKIQSQSATKSSNIQTVQPITSTPNIDSCKEERKKPF